MIVFKTNYGRFNAAEKVEFDKTIYKGVSDARIPGWVYNSFVSKIDQESCDFTYEFKQWVRYNGQHYDILSETDTVHFENDPEDGFSFHIDAVYGGTKYTLSYSNGTMTTKPAGGGEVRDAITDDEARLIINQITQPAFYEPYMVYSLKKNKNEEGSYTMYCKVADESTYELLVTEMGLGSYVGYDQTIYVIMAGKEVDKLEATITLKGTEGTYHITYKYDFEIKDTSDNTNEA
jgi:hypothetical protein